MKLERIKLIIIFMDSEISFILFHGYSFNGLHFFGVIVKLNKLLKLKTKLLLTAIVQSANTNA